MIDVYTGQPITIKADIWVSIRSSRRFLTARKNPVQKQSIFHRKSPFSLTEFDP